MAASNLAASIRLRAADLECGRLGVVSVTELQQLVHTKVRWVHSPASSIRFTGLLGSQHTTSFFCCPTSAGASTAGHHVQPRLTGRTQVTGSLRSL